MITSNKDFSVTANNCETPQIEVTIQDLDLTTAMTMATELILAYRRVEVKNVITDEIVYHTYYGHDNFAAYTSPAGAFTAALDVLEEDN